MEEWVLLVATNIIAIAVAFGVYRNKVNTLESQNKKFDHTLETIFQRLDKHGDTIVSLDTQSKLSMTAKDVDAKYVSKEVFRQMEKHIDSRFDNIDSKLAKVLEKLEG